MNRIPSILVLAFMSLLASCKVSESTSMGSDSTSMPWVVSTFAGTGTAAFANGAGTTARFNHPIAVAVDSEGNVYVADTGNHRIRKITPAGMVSTFAGDGNTTQFNCPTGVAVDSSGNVYVADRYNHRIRKITSTGVVSTFAGTGTAGYKDAAGNTARFNRPYGVAVDSSGNVYVADFDNHRIRKITPAARIEDRKVSTFAGSTAGYKDATGNTARFNYPSDVAVDSEGNVYVADHVNHRIRKITPAGMVSTIAGTGAAAFANGAGNATQFNFPYGVAVDSSGNVYVADAFNHRIRKITPAEMVSTLVGTGTSDFACGRHW